VTRLKASKGGLERTTRFRVWLDDVISIEVTFDSYEKKRLNLKGGILEKYLTKETIQ
jgi:hypothetical protein